MGKRPNSRIGGADMAKRYRDGECCGGCGHAGLTLDREGLCHGCWLATWERDAAAEDGERRSFSLLRATDGDAGNSGMERVRALVLQAYADQEDAIGMAGNAELDPDLDSRAIGARPPV